jgi:hypothetical protein
MSLMMFLMNIPFTGTVEAARVAVVPIQIDEKQVEKASDFTTYYWDVMVEMFKYPEYDLMDDDKVSEVLPEAGLSSFDQATLKDLVKKTDSEIVVAMRLNSVEIDEDNFAEEPIAKVYVRGEFASYNRLTGKYLLKKFTLREEVEPELLFKVDYPQRMFTSSLRRYIRWTADMKSKK